MLPRKNYHTCKACKVKFTDASDLLKLPFGGYMCNSCIDSQFDSELEDYNALPPIELDIFKDFEVPRTPATTNNNMGVKLYKLKNEINNFKEDIDNYEKRILTKIDAMKLTVDVNLNFCKHKVDIQKTSELTQLDIYKKQMLEKVDTFKIQAQKSKLTQKEEFLKKIKQRKFYIYYFYFFFIKLFI